MRDGFFTHGHSQRWHLRPWYPVASVSGRWKVTQLQPWLAPYVTRVLEALEAVGIGGTIYDVYRSPAEQERRFAAGDSRAHGGQSAHQYGLAFDFVVTEGEGSARQREVQALWAALGFTTISWDPAHVEFPNWKQFAGK